MERVWGGRRLAELFGKHLPSGTRIGESWEIVDRPEAQSTVRDGPWRGRTLHELWQNHRAEVFGAIADAPRFPLLVKLLDAQTILSLQVHPPSQMAAELEGEPKTELWYIAHAEPAAEIYAGLKKGTSRARLEAALTNGTVAEEIHRLPVRTGDAMFLPSGRLHAVGAGNVIVEIQENSDTTYRVFDWNRREPDSLPRTLHLAEAFRSIDFADFEPALLPSTSGESLVKNPLFDVEKWNLATEREVSPAGTFAIVGCLAGQVECAGAELKPGEFFLVPAALAGRRLRPTAPETTLLRVTIQN